jgi:hypothetical protein
MNTEVKTKLVLASVLAGASTMAAAIPMNAAPAGASPVRHELVVSQAALKTIDGKVAQAATGAEPSQERFYQIIRGPFVESGPDFVQSWSGQMRLP